MKKLIEIPFNHELIGQEGIVVKEGSENGDIMEVFVSKKKIKAGDMYPIIGVDENGNNASYDFLGRIGVQTSQIDLKMYQEIEVKEPRVIWVNIYPNNAIFAHNSKEDAFKDLMPSGKAVKFIEVIEEGE